MLLAWRLVAVPSATESILMIDAFFDAFRDGLATDAEIIGDGVVGAALQEVRDDDGPIGFR